MSNFKQYFKLVLEAERTSQYFCNNTFLYDSHHLNFFLRNDLAQVFINNLGKRDSDRIIQAFNYQSDDNRVITIVKEQAYYVGGHPDYRYIILIKKLDSKLEYDQVVKILIHFVPILIQLKAALDNDHKLNLDV